MMQHSLLVLSSALLTVVTSSALHGRGKDIIIPPGQIPPQPQNCDRAAVISIGSILTRDTADFPDGGASFCQSLLGIQTFTSLLSTTSTAAPTTATVTNIRGTLTVYAPAVTSTVTT